ncbi:MAG: apolipoprotein N-acyltransferase [Betaproteobacteria bacterium]|nr:apolipoprotein N-acyltransferase [Betaproteobacteria bacterium]
MSADPDALPVAARHAPQLRRWRSAAALGAAALGSGVLQGLSIAWPWGGDPLAWLQVLSLAALVALLTRTRSAAQAWVVGWLFATAWLCTVFWWLFISMNTYGHLPAWLSALSVLLLAAFLGINYALAAAAWRRWRPVGGALGFTALWTLAELARGWLWTGFPWGAGGYAHVDGWLAAWAPWAGVYGIGALAALGAASLAQLFAPPQDFGPPRPARARWLPALLALALTLTGLALPAQHSSDAGAFDVTLLQGNIPQDQKFRAEGGIDVALRWYAEQLLSVERGLVVAPETAIPLLPAQWPEALRDRLARHFADPGRAALIGVPLGDLSGYANSVIGLRAGAPAYRYDKHHLVPFGEFVPPMFRWFTEAMRIPLGEFRAGAASQASMRWQGQRLAPNVCYEDLFGEELARRFADPTDAPTVLVNVSNIAWFGDTVAIAQHLHIARMRTLEFQRPMARATNTGATVVIDHRGQVTHSVSSHVRAAARGTVQGRDGITPYAAWASKWGLLPLWALCLAILAGSWASARGHAHRAAKPPP